MLPSPSQNRRFTRCSFAAAAGLLLAAPLFAGDDAQKSNARPRYLENSLGMRFVEIPAGEFWMGAEDGDEDARGDEKPRHRVRIAKPFLLGVYEVTQTEYERVVGKNSSFFSHAGYGKARVAKLDTSRFPAEQVTWDDARTFCRKLSQTAAEQKAGRRYRLPTEAEWEYACRANTKTAFHYGDALSSEQANFNGNHPHGAARKGPFLARTVPVGSYRPNAFGLYDMHGNVWEWCSDWYQADYYAQSPLVNPTGPASGASPVIRGGAWYSDARDCRSAFRLADKRTGKFYVLGFRVVCQQGPYGALADNDRDVAAPATVAVINSAGDRGEANGAEVDWPRWRGPRGNGTWRAPQLAETWPAGGLKRLWQQPLGGGYGGVSVAGGRVFVMDRLTEPAERERVLAFDAASGKQLWTFEYAVAYGDLSYGNGPRATVTIAGGKAYALGATGRLHCLDAASGKLVWKADLVADLGGSMPGWGYACSPLIHENLIIVAPGTTREKTDDAANDRVKSGAGIVALDRDSGREVWRSLTDGAGYATSMIIDAPGGKQLACWTPQGIRGLNPSNGDCYWKVPFEVTYGTSIATPIYQDGLIVVCNYWQGSKAVRLDENRQAKVAWEDTRNLRGVMSQPLYRDGYAYLLDKRHGLTCFDLASGRKRWDDDNRLTPKGRNPQATLVWLGDTNRIIALDSEGRLVLARISPAAYQETSRTKIIGPTWAHPAYSGTRVFARNDEALVSVSLVEPAE